MTGPRSFKVLLYCPRTIMGIGATEAFAIACPLELAVRTFFAFASDSAR